jgi:hypothetical protein
MGHISPDCPDKKVSFNMMGAEEEEERDSTLVVKDPEYESDIESGNEGTF